MPYGYGPMGPRASTTRPAVSSDPYGVQTWFKDASAPGAKDGTVIPASWLNTIIGERLHLAQSAGIAVNSNLPNDALLADSVTAIANARVAAGTAAAVIVARLDAYLGAGWRATLTGSQIVDAIDGALSSTNWRSFNPDTYWRKDQDIVSPTFVGTPTAPTAALGTDTDQIATMAAIKDAIDELAAAKQAAHDRLSDIAGIAWAQGDIAYFNGTNLVRLPAGTDGHFLKTRGAGANPEWAAGGGGSFSGGDLLSALGIVVGTEAAPGIYFVGDTDTGLYQPAAAPNVLGIVTQGALRWKVDASGHLLAEDTNTYDIGASGGNKPRSIYAANSIYAGNHVNLVGALLWGNGSNIQSPSSGVMTLYNNGNSSFGRLQLGGTGSGSPSIKVSGTAIHLRLADDSAFTEFKASILECGTSIKFPDATTQTTAANPKVDLIGSWAHSTDVAQVEITWTAGTYAKVWIETDNLSGTANAALVATLRNASAAVVTLTSNDTTTAAGALSVDAQFTIGLNGATKYCSGVMVDSVAAVYAVGSNGTAPDRVRIAWATGNIDGGSIRVYGLKAS